MSRTRLSARLTQAAAGPVTLVSAGPGSGKTLAVAAWAVADQAAGPVAWLTLDGTDDDPATFWYDVLAALTASGGVPPGNPLRDLVPSTRFDPSQVDRIRAGLLQIDSPLVLVLDDLHIVSNPGVLDSLNRLVDRPLTTLRLVLVSRADPPLRLHRLRVSGDLAEIRTDDLAFDDLEADLLFTTHALTLTTEQRAALLARTEGWAAGLRLAAMSLDPHDVDAGIAEFSGDERTVAEYLAGEVLNRQPEAVRAFLLRTSVADRLNGSLAETLTGRTDSRWVLERLAHDNALVVELGRQRDWFHYHPLLRDLLLHRLLLESPALVPELHVRAAHWFAAHGALIDAIRHAVAAEDWRLVGRTLCTAALPKLASPEGSALAAALQPAAVRATREPTIELLLCAAACHAHRHDYAAMDHDLAQARRLIADPTGPADTSTDRRVAEIVITLLETNGARMRGDIDELVHRARRTLELIDHTPPHDLPVAAHYRVVAQSNLGVGLFWSGQLAEAEACLAASLARTEELDLGLAHLNVLAHLALIHTMRGRLRTAHECASAATALAERRGWMSEPQVVAAFLALALVNLQWNNLADAQRHLQLGLAASQGQTDRTAHLGIRLAQARLHMARGRVQETLTSAASLREAADTTVTPKLLARWIALVEADALLLAGEAAAALDRIGRPNTTGASPQERVRLARARLALGQPHDAERLLQPVLRSPSPDLGLAVDAWLVAALVADRLRRDSTAAEALTNALALAEPEGIRLPFLVLGPHAAILLSRQRHIVGSNPEFAAEILADLAPNQGPREPPPPLAEPLTDRELTVLRYLPTMLSNSEIGADLCVTVNTVKAHLKTLYRKLGVTNRRQAVHRARELGLL